MSARVPWALAWRDMAAARGRSALCVVGVALGAMVLALAAGLGLAVEDLVLREVVRELPVDIIEVRPRSLDLGLFKMEAGGLLGGATLDDAAVAALAARPEVAAVYPRLEVPLPIGAEGGTRLFGRRLYTDLFMTALPQELVEAPLRARFVDRPDVVPVLISDQLIEIYNAQVAGALGTPQLTATSLDGFVFDLVLGRSLLLGSRGAARSGIEPAQIVGTSRYAMRLGVTVPLATARRLLQKYAATPAAATPYSALLVRARRAADVPSVAAAVEGMGLQVDATAQRTRRMLQAGTALAASVGVLVLALAALNIANSFAALLLARRRELGILRAVGARRQAVATLLLLQAAAVGLLGGVCGLALAHAAAGAATLAARHLLPQVPFLPATLFLLPGWLHALTMLLALLTALAGAAGPTLWAAARPLPEALAD